MRHVTSLQILTFVLTHENKSYSAFAKDQHKHVTDTNKDTQVSGFCHVGDLLVGVPIILTLLEFSHRGVSLRRGLTTYMDIYAAELLTCLTLLSL